MIITTIAIVHRNLVYLDLSHISLLKNQRIKKQEKFQSTITLIHLSKIDMTHQNVTIYYTPKSKSHLNIETTTIVILFLSWRNQDLNKHLIVAAIHSLMTEAKVSPAYIKLIVGHKRAMNVTEEVYTHIDMKYLLQAINSIYYPEHLKSSN